MAKSWTNLSHPGRRSGIEKHSEALPAGLCRPSRVSMSLCSCSFCDELLTQDLQILILCFSLSPAGSVTFQSAEPEDQTGSSEPHKVIYVLKSTPKPISPTQHFERAFFSGKQPRPCSEGTSAHPRPQLPPLLAFSARGSGRPCRHHRSILFSPPLLIPNAMGPSAPSSHLRPYPLS